MVKQGFVYGMVLMLTAGLSACMGNGGEDEMKQRQLEMRSHLESKIAEVDRAMDRLNEEARASGEQARASVDVQLERLEETRDDLSRKLEELSDTTVEKWDEFARSVQRSLRNAEQTLKEI